MPCKTAALLPASLRRGQSAGVLQGEMCLAPWDLHELLQESLLEDELLGQTRNW